MNTSGNFPIPQPTALPRRGFLRQLSLLAAAGVIYRNAMDLWGLPADAPAKPIRLIVDADTANEIDDVFALARALMEPRFQVEGVTSSQWHTQPEAPRDTVGPSKEMNEQLLRVMKRTDVPHPIGSNLPLVSPQRPQPSDAARHIIRKALETPEGEKLIVAILGPCTNLASAVLMEPAIIPRVSCHFIGLRYDHKQRLWSRDEFNTNNDPNALDVLLNAPGLEFHLMTATASGSLVFEKAEVDRRLKGKGALADSPGRNWPPPPPSTRRLITSNDRSRSGWRLTRQRCGKASGAPSSAGALSDVESCLTMRIFKKPTPRIQPQPTTP